MVFVDSELSVNDRRYHSRTHHVCRIRLALPEDVGAKGESDRRTDQSITLIYPVARVVLDPNHFVPAALKQLPA